MASITKGMNISGISPKGIFVALLVVLLIAALFFIPEIIRLQKSIIGFGGGSTTSPSKKIEVAKDGQPESALDQISNMVSGNYIEQLKAKKVMSTMGSASSKPASTKAGEKLPQRVTWEDIKSKESASALRAAQKEAHALARTLPADKSSSRFALYGFSSSVDMVLDDADKTMSPEDAIRYLQYAQLMVTKAFEREGVERSDYNKWVETSLGSAIEKKGLVQVAKERMPFNPRLALTNVKVFQPVWGDIRYHGDGPAYMHIRGSVVGKEVKRVEIWRGLKLMAKMTPTKPNEFGRRYFRTKQLNARGVFQFRVKDVNGNIYEKVYSFYPRVRKFARYNGKYQIPFQDEADTRLDRFFTKRAGRMATGQPDAVEDVGETVEYSTF